MITVAREQRCGASREQGWVLLSAGAGRSLHTPQILCFGALDQQGSEIQRKLFCMLN